MPIALLALAMLVQMMSGGAGLRNLGREDAIATVAAQSVLEEMRNEDFRTVFAMYNADPLDDPAGPGTAPGHRFAVEGLQPIASATDGAVGEVILPTVNTGSAVAPIWEVRENLVNPLLGTPRDLSGDAVINDENHAADYTLLPIVVVLRWQGSKGARESRIVTILTEFHQ